MKRREFLFLAASSVGLAGQSGASDLVDIAVLTDMAKRRAGPTPAPINCLAPAGSEDNLNAVVAAWRKATGIPVTLDIVDVDDINNRMTIDHLARRAAYDVALPATFGVADLAWSGVVQPMSPIETGLGAPSYDSLGTFDLGNVLGGRRYGCQTDGDVYLMFYRRDWLDHPERQAAYGDATGEALGQPKTWTELDRQIAFFNRPERGEYGGALFRTPAYAVWEFWSRMHANGVAPFDDDLTPMIAEEGAVDALQAMIRTSTSLHPSARTAGLFENWRQFEAGQIYCNIGWGGSQKFFNRPVSRIRGKLAFASPPGGRAASMSYFNWGWSYVIPANSPKPDIAFLFSAFATSPEISTLAVREAGGYFDPFLDEHYEDPQIREAYSAAFLQVHQRAMQDPLPDLYLPGHGSYFASLAGWIERVALGEVSASEGLRRAALDWRVISLDFDEVKQTERWREIYRNYPAYFRRG
ncbi:MAG: extracellular solute-binding protein [Pseudomonadota bacterium]